MRVRSTVATWPTFGVAPRAVVHDWAANGGVTAPDTLSVDIVMQARPEWEHTRRSGSEQPPNVRRHLRCA